MSEPKMQNLYTSKNKTYKILGLVLILFGMAGATFPFWNVSFAPSDNPLEKLGANEIAAQLETITPSPSQDSIVPNSTLAPKTKLVIPTNNNRLILASAGVDMPLLLSADDKVLLRGGWMYSGNSTPDKGGNTVIFGHRWLYRPPVKNTFFNLDKTKVGDKFSIAWNGTIYNYQVSEIKIIDPTEVSILNPTDSAQVTLITCTPLFSTKQRLVVIGKLI